ncbi:HlyD family type I secretion periplasmic adaptor subunit [Pelovirga terrestris]|uniref:HlyD family type I secretion periplasmic adaptor subunit n=1 Tax=Pelovirga terrestris TaxID=2771352 RepID=A0A8J6QPZ5_9BACT|nr:HlyD family type I secretion periplasmic adaptor subunit [Pelovirga terrestris]MBD1400751.1 HlyD family type I secretion periplasmic adaptor subunit [Pelovirga terrestris]
MRQHNNDQHEFKPLLVEIEERPLNPLGRIIFWIIIGAMGFAALWLVIGKVDVVVTARGKVIPTGEVKTVQPLSGGVARSILVAAGDYVRQGQVLMEIDPSSIDPELVSLSVDLRQVEIERERINALLTNRAFLPADPVDPSGLFTMQYEIFLAEKERLQQQLGAHEAVLRQLSEQSAMAGDAADYATTMVAQLGERLQRLEQVRDIISREEFEQVQAELYRFENELTGTRRRKEEISARKQQTLQELAVIREDFRNRLLQDLAEKSRRLLYLQAQIEQKSFLSGRQQITAPVDGYVSRLLFHTVGGVVGPAEILAYIVPEQSPLMIRALLQNKDAGFVMEGMDVSIKVDTFNFQKYGILEGKVLQVARDSIDDDLLGLVYELYVDPQQTHLSVDGVETPIVTGMSVTAEIKVGKRRIIEFFLYPLIRYLDEGISVR